MIGGSGRSLSTRQRSEMARMDQVATRAQSRSSPISMSGFEPLAVDRALSAWAFTIAVLTVAWFIHLFSSAAWIHPELLGSSAYVWLYPGQESFAQMLRKVFDWKGFDPNVNRVRPLNDVFEVIDAIARPYITHLVGPQAALNVSTIATMVAAPSLLFGWLKRAMRSWGLALILTMIFIASTGFLSLTVAYLHPAKKVNLVLLCAALLFAQRDRDGAPGHNFLWLQVCLICSTFADELGLANGPIIAILYWRTLLTRTARIVAFVALPIVFLGATKWALPAIYLKFSVHGAWDALSDAKKFSVFGYLFNLQFYQSAAVQLSRSVMSTVGISTHTTATELATLAVVLTSPLLRFLTPAPSRAPLLQCPLFLSMGSLAAASTYATLLDWYPFPYEVSYLGSFNYYYHSSIIVSVIVWIAFLIRELLTVVSPMWRRQAAWALSIVGAACVVFNFSVFDRVNRLVEIIHYYPFSRDELFRAADQVKRPARGEKLTFVAVADSVGERARYEADLRALFGDRLSDNGYVSTFAMVERTPIMTRAHLAHFFHAFYPLSPISVDVRQPGLRP
jgi:hypothetical protein